MITKYTRRKRSSLFAHAHRRWPGWAFDRLLSMDKCDRKIARIYLMGWPGDEHQARCNVRRFVEDPGRFIDEMVGCGALE